MQASIYKEFSKGALISREEEGALKRMQKETQGHWSLVFLQTSPNLTLYRDPVCQALAAQALLTLYSVGKKNYQRILLINV